MRRWQKKKKSVVVHEEGRKGRERHEDGAEHEDSETLLQLEWMRGLRAVSSLFAVVMFGYDIAICSKNRKQVEESLDWWRYMSERRGMNVSTGGGRSREAVDLMVPGCWTQGFEFWEFMIPFFSWQCFLFEFLLLFKSPVFFLDSLFFIYCTSPVTLACTVFSLSFESCILCVSYLVLVTDDSEAFTCVSVLLWHICLSFCLSVLCSCCFPDGAGIAL